MLEILKIMNELSFENKISKILTCNEVSSCYGVILKREDVEAILQTQKIVLYEVGRLEFEGTIIEQIIYAFCDSLFITKYEYVEIIHRLVEIFYCYKAEIDEEMMDEEIIEYMKRSFDGPCQGSFDWLEDHQLTHLLESLEENKDIYEDEEYGYF